MIAMRACRLRDIVFVLQLFCRHVYYDFSEQKMLRAKNVPSADICYACVPRDVAA